MNIFLDTSVLYKDPYWRGNFAKELLDILKEKEINIYISSVVVMEMERNYGKIVDEEILRLKKTKEQADHYRMVISKPVEIDREKSINNLKTFYNKLKEENLIKVVDYTNDMMPEIVERAVLRKKPFSEGKTEMKDAIIWLSYAKLAEAKKLRDCIFLTDNVSDFCDNEKLKDGIFEVHPELKKDSARFKIYRSQKELIQQEKSKLQFASKRFTSWLKEQNFDQEFLLNLIKMNYHDLVERKIERQLERYEPHEIFDEDYYSTGYVSPRDFDINYIENINVDVFNEECLISGDLYVYCNVEGYEYNSVRDSGEDKYRYFGDRDVLIRLSFSFNYDNRELATNFEVDSVALAEKM